MSPPLVGGCDVARLLRSSEGLRIRLGPFVARLHSPLPDVAAAVSRLYAGHTTAAPGDFVDFEVAVRRPTGLRGWWKPQVVFEFEGNDAFNPLPGDQGFPLLEWGLNWCVYTHAHQYLILHAAVLERGGRALVMPAPSGSGKSTLCAGLAFSGWRLLSDELALIEPGPGHIVPIPRPVSLKNESLAVMRRFVPGLVFGSEVSETAKGTVAHFAPPAEALARAAEPARPGWVVLPRYVPDQAARLEPMEKAEAFMRLVENAFNYPVFGALGFEVLAALVDRSDCFSFEYSDLADAARTFDELAEGRR